MHAKLAVDDALAACRDAVADYQAGVLDDRGLREALLEAGAVVETPRVRLDRLIRVAVSLPSFTDDALGELRRSIDRLSEAPAPRST